jgi:hypothetical protein
LGLARPSNAGDGMWGARNGSTRHTRIACDFFTQFLFDYVTKIT